MTIKNQLSALATEHIVEPITKLGEEFFEKLHRREGIVSREDLIQSKEALSRMLADFWEHGQRSFDVKQMMRGASAVPSGFNNTINTTKHDNLTLEVDSKGDKYLFYSSYLLLLLLPLLLLLLLLLPLLPLLHFNSIVICSFLFVLFYLFFLFAF